MQFAFVRKSTRVALTVAALVGLAACGGKEDEATPPEDAAAEAPAASADAPPADAPAAAEAPAPAVTPVALPGAPAFAVLFPGAEVQGDVTGAETEDAGQGGIVTFTTDAPASEVVTFYRQRAEEAGLTSVMAMNQGETQAYGARSAQTDANLSVVASPAEGRTSVQLSWSAGG